MYIYDPDIILLYIIVRIDDQDIDISNHPYDNHTWSGQSNSLELMAKN